MQANEVLGEAFGRIRQLVERSVKKVVELDIEIVHSDQDRVHFVFRNDDASGWFAMPTTVMTHANSEILAPLDENHALKDIRVQISEIQQKYAIIGRSDELYLLLIALHAKKNIILEGDVGTGKTYLARSLAQFTNQKFFAMPAQVLKKYIHNLQNQF